MRHAACDNFAEMGLIGTDDVCELDISYILFSMVKIRIIHSRKSPDILVPSSTKNGGISAISYPKNFKFQD